MTNETDIAATPRDDAETRKAERLTVDDAARRWGLSPRRVRALCAAGKVAGAERTEDGWRIDPRAARPADGRAERYLKVPAGLKDLCARAIAEIRQGKAAMRDSPPTEKDWNRARLDYRAEAVFRSQDGLRDALTRDGVRKVLSDRALATRPLSVQISAVRFAGALDRQLDLARNGARIEAKLVREANSMVLHGHPDAAHPFPGTDLDDHYNLRLRIMLEDYRRSGAFAGIRLARLMRDFLDLEPFEDGNIRTLILLVNHLLVSDGHPPVLLHRRDILRDYGVKPAPGNADPLARTVTTRMAEARPWAVLAERNPVSVRLGELYQIRGCAE